jgi:hypothetical protein
MSLSFAMVGLLDRSSAIAAPTAQSPTDQRQGGYRINRLRLTNHSNAPVRRQVEWNISGLAKAGTGLGNSFLTVWPPRETRMENDLLELANRLRLAAGMIMEDHDLIAVGRSESIEDLGIRLHALGNAGTDIAKLVAAAQVLIRLG